MSDGETTRTAVRTYVPAYQKERWAEEAEELDMSRSEFVRTMVQAGRRSFDLDDSPDSGSDGGVNESIEEGGDGDELADRVLAILRDRGEPQTWDDLVAAVTDDVEARLDEALADLQDEGTIRYSGRDGGYVRNGGT